MENLFEFSPLIIGIVPVIVPLVSMICGMGLSKKYAPLVSIGVGIGGVALTGITFPAFVIQGILAGLAASGAYSGVVKPTLKNLGFIGKKKDVCETCRCEE